MIAADLKTNSQWLFMMVIIVSVNIKQIRKDLNLTQRQLAKELGLAKNGDVYIRKVENGRAQPSGLLLKALEMFCELKKYEKN
jgi:transcriptional regulator with XRE-family HTH domain